MAWHLEATLIPSFENQSIPELMAHRRAIDREYEDLLAKYPQLQKLHGSVRSCLDGYDKMRAAEEEQQFSEGWKETNLFHGVLKNAKDYAAANDESLAAALATVFPLVEKLVRYW